jgi:hypothetical protein
MPELVLNLGQDQVKEQGFVSKATDPVLPGVTTPGDFAAQYPTPLDTTELLAMCEEVNLLRAIPDESTGLKAFTYREMDELAFVSGSSYVSFADGACPENYEHDGDNVTATLKNIGAYKSLTLSDIMHSAAVAGMSQGGFGVGIDSLNGPMPAGQGLPGVAGVNTLANQAVANLKAKEMALMATLVLNGEDRLLVRGNASSNALEYDGIETLITSGNGSHTNASSEASGTFSGANFDRFLAEGCAKPTAVFGHPTAIQEMMSAYFQLGYQGSQLVNHNDGSRIVPGYNFAGEVNTGIGTLMVVADSNFTRTASSATTFQSSLYALRMSHNGEPLIFRKTQIPLAFKDLAPGCTAIAFQIWKKTVLVAKARCAHGKYTSLFSGRSVSTCPVVHLSND